MRQVVRNATMEGCGVVRDFRYLLYDRDANGSGCVLCDHRQTSDVKRLALPREARIKSAKEE
jgi:hypothetical protein